MSTDVVPVAGAGLAFATFTREQVELIKRTVAQGTSDDELALFLEVARRRNLDPFARQVYAVMRYDSRQGRDVMTIQVGIDGYRSLAARTHLIEYVEGPLFTGDGQTWVDVWLEDAPPSAARFTVKRKDRSRSEQRTATWREYAQRKQNGDLTAMWAQLGVTMLGKVAEAHALRAAFPDELGGLYTAEELDQGENPPPTSSDPSTSAEVDHPEQRRELYDRWRPWWASLTDEERNDVWKDVRPRLYGSGTLGDAFAATPLHVLEELVETYVGTVVEPEDDPEDDPDDGAPATIDVDPEPDDEPDAAEPDDGHRDELAPEPSDEEPAARSARPCTASSHRGPLDRIDTRGGKRCRACGETLGAPQPPEDAASAPEEEPAPEDDGGDAHEPHAPSSSPEVDDRPRCPSCQTAVDEQDVAALRCSWCGNGLPADLA